MEYTSLVENGYNNLSIIDLIINLIIGLVFGIIIYTTFLKKNLLVGPDSKEIMSKTYKDDKGEYKWKPIITICPLGTVHVEH